MAGRSCRCGQSRGCPSRGVWAGGLVGAAAHEGGWTENLADTGPVEGRPVTLSLLYFLISMCRTS